MKTNTETQIFTKDSITTIRILNSGKDLYQSFYFYNNHLYHVINGGKSCEAEQKTIIAEKFNINYNDIKIMYACKKHNNIIKKITGSTITDIKKGLNKLINNLSN